MDMKTTFLNGVIEEEVYIEQPQGFEVEDRWIHIWKLKKALYGLKQAPRAWYGRIDRFLTSLGFTKSKVDPNLYLGYGWWTYHIIVVCGLLFLIWNEKHIVEWKKKITEESEMKDLRLMHCFLGLEVWRNSEGIFLRQGKYIV